MEVRRCCAVVAVTLLAAGCAAERQTTDAVARQPEVVHDDRPEVRNEPATLTGTRRMPSTQPSKIPTVPGASGIAPGYEHLCVIANGSVWCAGRNQYGQLGDDTTTDSTEFVNTGITDATDLAAGPGSNCAIRAGGTVWCWGYRATASRLDVSVPQRIEGVRRARRISGGDVGACVTTFEGQAVCWGDPVLTGTERSEPRAITLPVPITSVAVGSQHACAVGTDHRVWCWGDNRHGQLGVEPVDDALGPVPVPGIDNAIQVAAGGVDGVSCAVLIDGAVSCWGEGSYGQTGAGAKPGRQAPALVPGVTGARSVAVGAFHACAGLVDGTVTCWGRGAYLGTEVTVDPSPPVAVPQLTGVITVRAQSLSTCALRTSPPSSCWGLNSSGQLRNDARSKAVAPADVIAVPAT